MNFYKDGVISIQNVTGDVVITASAVEQPRPQIVVNIVHGGFNHSTGDDFTTGETDSATYSKSQVIDVLSYSSVTVTYDGGGSAGDIYIYYAGDDNIITSFEVWKYGTQTVKTLSFPSGTKKIRFRGYDTLYNSKDHLEFVFN